VYKVEYQLNQLCNMSTEDGEIIDAVAQSDEYAIFKTDCVMDMIDFKWDMFAAKMHYVGMVVHIVYCVYLLIYVKTTFLDKDEIMTDDIVPMHAVKKDHVDMRKAR